MDSDKNERRIDNAKGRFRTIAAVLVLLARKGQDGDMECLLQKRQNTGFADGMWDFSATGHVEKDEPMTSAVCREVREEISIDILPEDVEFIGVMHTFGDGEPRILGCFKVDKYRGDVEIGEPDKVAELKWFSINDLPENLIDTRKKALECYKNSGVFYQELGW